jgi:uncharacterized protein YraI
MRTTQVVLFGLLAIAGCAGGNGTGEEGDSQENTGDFVADNAIVGQKARVTASDGLNLRTGPSTNYNIILTMPNGATVDVSAASNGWYKVSYNGHVGWCSGVWLTPVSGGGGGGGTGPGVDKAMARAQSGVGFSYHWGGGCWDPGASHGACYGSCPNCSHSGQWGADCSGYVAKVWQVPGPSATTSCSHPYSTWNFANTNDHWSGVSRSNVKKGDAYVYHTNGAGHIFLFDHGDPWGSVWAYECKGCSYGCVHDLRTAYSNYKAIRREGF